MSKRKPRETLLKSGPIKVGLDESNTFYVELEPGHNWEYLSDRDFRKLAAWFTKAVAYLKHERCFSKRKKRKSK